MKIAITGKGGVGKTTVAAILARLYADEGRKVLAADVDPDANFGMALGFHTGGAGRDHAHLEDARADRRTHGRRRRDLREVLQDQSQGR